MINKKAFTLTELLIALAIIGAIGGLTLPSLLTAINDKILNTKYENTKQQMQQLILEQFMIHKTKELRDTDFANPELLLGVGNSNIEVTNPDDCERGQNCIAGTAWQTEDYYLANANDKSKEKRDIVLYQTKTEENDTVITKDISLANTTANDDKVRTGTLKNGVLATYYYDKDNPGGNGTFILDLNGPAGPNVIDKDVRSFIITNNGQIMDVNITTASIENNPVGPIIPSNPDIPIVNPDNPPECMIFCLKGQTLDPVACKCVGKPSGGF